MKLNSKEIRIVKQYHWICPMCGQHKWEYSEELLRKAVEGHNHPLNSPLKKPIPSIEYSNRVKKGWETRRKKAEAEELRVKNEEFPPYPAGPQQ